MLCASAHPLIQAELQQSRVLARLHVHKAAQGMQERISPSGARCIMGGHHGPWTVGA